MPPNSFVPGAAGPPASGNGRSSVSGRRGVDWVLRQTAILAVLGLTGAHLAGVACLAAAERRLVRVAETAVAEAALPEATLHSIQRQAILLLGTQDRGLPVSLLIHRNGEGFPSGSRLRRGEQVRITLSAPSRSALPTWLSRLLPWLAGDDLRAVAEVTVP